MMFKKKYFKNKKGIGPIVAVTLLIVIAVLSVLGFQRWYSFFSSNLYNNAETESSSVFNNLDIKGVYNGKLYIKLPSDANITQVKIGGIYCNITNISLNKGINKIDVTSCLNNLTTNTPEIVVLTDKGIVQEKVYIKLTFNKLLNTNTISKIFNGINISNGNDILEYNNNIFVVGYEDITDNSNPGSSADIFLLKMEQDGNFLWNKTYGSTNYFERPQMMLKVSDGLVIVGGVNSSTELSNCLIIKTDFNGNVIWNLTLGNSSYFDFCDSLIETSEGNLLVLGTTNSYSIGEKDVWLIKLDQNSNIIWNKTYGTTKNEWGEYLTETNNGDILIVSDKNNWDAEGYNVWILRINSSGDLLWNVSYHLAEDHVRGVYELTNTDILVFAYTYYNNQYDYWILKLNSTGGEVWNKTYGGSGDEVIKSDFYVKNESEIFLPGFTTSYGNGGEDFWILKIDSNGNVLWNKTYGGSSDERIYGIGLSSDNGILVTGYTKSFGLGNENVWILKTDTNGNICDYSVDGLC